MSSRAAQTGIATTGGAPTSQVLNRFRVALGVTIGTRGLFFDDARCDREVPRRLRGSG